MTIERLPKMEGGKYRHLADSNHLQHLRNGEANILIRDKMLQFFLDC